MPRLAAGLEEGSKGVWSERLLNGIGVESTSDVSAKAISCSRPSWAQIEKKSTSSGMSTFEANRNGAGSWVQAAFEAIDLDEEIEFFCWVRKGNYTDLRCNGRSDCTAPHCLFVPVGGSMKSTLPDGSTGRLPQSFTRVRGSS